MSLPFEKERVWYLESLASMDRSFLDVVDLSRTMEELHHESYVGSNKRPRYQGGNDGS